MYSIIQSSILVLLFILIGNLISSLYSNYQQKKIIDSCEKLDEQIILVKQKYNLAIQLNRKITDILSVVRLDSLSEKEREEVNMVLKEMILLLEKLEV